MIRVAVVDNHEVVRAGVEGRLREVADLQVVASVPDLEGHEASGCGADVVLLDLWLDDGDSIAAIPGLVAGGCAVVLYTSEQRPVPLRRAVEAGATGLVLKSDTLAAVVDGVRSAAAGEFYCSGPLAHALLTDEAEVAELSSRQVEILQALAEGLDYRGTARLLGLSEGSLKTHLTRIRTKFRQIGIEPRNTIDIVRLAQQQGHLAP